MKAIMILWIMVSSILVLGQDLTFNYQTDFPKILAQSNDAASPLFYDKLLPRFKASDTTMTPQETLALLIGFTSKEHFKPYHYLETERKIFSLNDDGEFSEALNECNSFLLNVPVSQRAIIEKSYAFHKLGKADSAAHYMWQFRMIMRAMAVSGDGKSPETAFFALGPTDGQNFIRKFLGSRIGTMGSGRDKHGNFVDILDVKLKDPDSEEYINVSMYFQIEHATNTMFSGIKLDLSTDEKKGKKRKKKKRKN